MLESKMSSKHCASSASEYAEAGFAYPSCAAAKDLSFTGISLLVSVFAVFAVIRGLCGEAAPVGGGLLLIITVPVLIAITGVAIIYTAVFDAQRQNA